MAGHGYDNEIDVTVSDPKSPHTDHEKYEGLGVLNAAEVREVELVLG